MYRSVCFLAPRSLQFMLKRFKLAGAHPDVIGATDPAKAHHNGEQLILLESLIQKRSQETFSAANDTELRRNYHFKFWLKPQGRELLFSVTCDFTPSASDSIVKQQLRKLFADAGIVDDFDLPGTAGQQSTNFASVLESGRRLRSEFQSDVASLLSIGEKCLSDLRQFGVIVLLEDDPVASDVYCLTMPFDEFDKHSSAAMLGPGNSVSPEVQKFLADRNLEPFDLRLSSGQQGLERIVLGLQRLHRLYMMYRGRSIRAGVCYIMSARATTCSITMDSCVRLPLSRMLDWDAYLLARKPSDWQQLVESNSEWRAAGAAKLHARLRSLKRLADIFNVFEVRARSSPGRSAEWIDEMVLRFIREEVAIRTALNKYGIKDPVIKARGSLFFEERLWSLRNPSDEVAYRIQSDGKLFFSATKSTTKSILRTLRDNISHAGKFLARYDNAMAGIQRVAMQLQLQVGFETNWKNRVIVFDPLAPKEANFIHCLETFQSTLAQAGPDLRPLLARHGHKGQMFLISDRYHATSQGFVCIPWDVDLASIKQFVLAPR